MGTYIPYLFSPMCDEENCLGGWDVHPNNMYPEVEAWFIRGGQHKKECCRWDMYHRFHAIIQEQAGNPEERHEKKVKCRFGKKCKIADEVHIYECSHPFDDMF